MIPVQYSPIHSEESRHVLVGHSARTRNVRRMIERMGKCRWPALLLGETGTGKEVVARAIHAQSKAINAREPFVTIDCSSMVGPLMESELFGHVKGAFTGAATAKIGLIEAANGGTAFFDEIGELPLDLQAKLLRVLQEKEYRPVGSLSTRRSDFRIIAATNRDLAKEVEKGTFRRDLYFRLNVINVRLAPLRERKEDIPALINHFLGRANANYSLTSEAVEVILGYDWPGNIRELRELCSAHDGRKLGSAAACGRLTVRAAELRRAAEVAVHDDDRWGRCAVCDRGSGSHRPSRRAEAAAIGDAVRCGRDAQPRLHHSADGT